MNVNKKLTAGIATIVGLGAVAWGGIALAPASAQAPFGTPRQGQRERHPELQRALRALERTEYDLRHAARDFGGHREKAADLCHQAEQEIQLAIQSDRH